MEIKKAFHGFTRQALTPQATGITGITADKCPIDQCKSSRG
jgi:hypothetical protein